MIELDENVFILTKNFITLLYCFLCSFPYCSFPYGKNDVLT